MGAGVGPDSFVKYPAQAKEEKPEIQPFARALTQYFSSSTWRAVLISTSSPAEELTDFMYRGLYRQEIIQLILIAEKSGKSFAELAKEREKGLRFEEMTGKLNIDFTEIMEKSLEIRKTVDDKILPGIDVSSGTEKTGDSPAPEERP